MLEARRDRQGELWSNAWAWLTMTEMHTSCLARNLNFPQKKDQMNICGLMDGDLPVHEKFRNQVLEAQNELNLMEK